MVVLRGKDSDYSGIYAEFGFQFDGFGDYRRLEETVKSSIYVDPTFYNMTEMEMEVTATAVSLTLRGNRLTECCNVSDYVVRVGEELCPVKHLFSKQLICQLPESWRLSGSSDTRNVTVRLISC